MNSTALKISVFPVTASCKVDFKLSGDEYDITEIENIDLDSVDKNGNQLAMVETWKYKKPRSKCVLTAYEPDAIDSMVELYQAKYPNTKPILLVWNGKTRWGDIFVLMVPDSFKIGDPIVFNFDGKNAYLEA